MRLLNSEFLVNRCPKGRRERDGRDRQVDTNDIFKLGQIRPAGGRHRGASGVGEDDVELAEGLHGLDDATFDGCSMLGVTPALGLERGGALASRRGRNGMKSSPACKFTISES